jgi:hypothetical protein
VVGSVDVVGVGWLLFLSLAITMAYIRRGEQEFMKTLFVVVELRVKVSEIENARTSHICILLRFSMSSCLT